MTPETFHNSKKTTASTKKLKRNEDCLTLHIEAMRAEMESLGMQKGFHNSEVIQISQRLDGLIVQHQRKQVTQRALNAPRKSIFS